LTGIFEVRIYPVDLAVPNIVEASRNGPNSLDLNRLSNILSGIDYASIRERRKLYSRLYYEASISHRQGRGIGFTDMLILLAHHKLIVDRDALMFVIFAAFTKSAQYVPTVSRISLEEPQPRKSSLTSSTWIGFAHC
jgi:hypothetical protein